MFTHSPFAFKGGGRMENHYIHYFLGSNPDRALQLIKYFWIPVILPLRIMRCVYWILYPGEFDYPEILGAIFKFIVAIIIFILVSKVRGWSESARQRVGLFQLSMVRLFCVVTILEQSKKDRNANTFFAYVCFLCLSGFIIPRYSEYLALAIVISFVRPVQMWLSYSSDSQSIQEIAYQHTLVLALFISIHWTIHSDFRRDWLRSPSVHISHAVMGTRPINGGGAACAAEWDMLQDDYFSHTDHLELSAQALQVSTRGALRLRQCWEVTFRLLPLFSLRPPGTGRHRGATGRPARLRAAVALRAGRDRRRAGGPRLPGLRLRPASRPHCPCRYRGRDRDVTVT